MPSAEMFATMIAPALEHVPTPRNRRIVHARGVMDRIGRQLLEERTAEVACVRSLTTHLANTHVAISADEKGIKSRDLLSLLIRANLAETNVKRLSDDEMLARETHNSSLKGCLRLFTYGDYVQRFLLSC
jgi:cytochrome P450